MPYKSEAQRRYFNANRDKLEAEGVDVDEWNQSSKGKKMPEKAAIEKLARCWKGYEPVPGKAPYSNDSCRPKGSKAKKKDEKKASLIPDFNSVRGLAKLAALGVMCSCGQPEDECGCNKQASCDKMCSCGKSEDECDCDKQANDDSSMLGRLAAGAKDVGDTAAKHLGSARNYVTDNVNSENLALGMPLAGASLGAVGGNLLHRLAGVVRPQKDDEKRKKSRNVAMLLGAGLGGGAGLRGLSSPKPLVQGSFPESQAESFSGLA